MNKLKLKLKQALLPNRSLYLRAFNGLAQGAIVHVNPQHELRRFLGIDERQLIPIFRRLLKPGMNSFDVGGSTGYYAVSFANMTGGRVVTFEPNAQSAAATREAVARNGFKVTVENVCVAAADSPSSVTLDSACRKHFFPDFIKMDIEGAEANALRGATEILRRRRTAWIVETHNREIDEECENIFRSFALKVTPIEMSSAEIRLRGTWTEFSFNRWLIAEPNCPR